MKEDNIFNMTPKLPENITELLNNHPFCSLSSEDVRTIIQNIDAYRRLKDLHLTDPDRYAKVKNGLFTSALNTMIEFGADGLDLESLYPLSNRTDIRIAITAVFEQYGKTTTEKKKWQELGVSVANIITELQDNKSRSTKEHEKRTNKKQEIETAYRERILDKYDQEIFESYALDDSIVPCTLVKS